MNKYKSRLPKSKDIHKFWVYLPSLSKVKGSSPQECGFIFQENVKKFLQRQLHYIPFEITRIKGISGLEHEYDSVFIQDLKTKDILLFFECKWHQRGNYTSRYDVMIFNQKAFDVFYQMKAKNKKFDMYRILVSSTPLTSDAFKLCLTLGILALQPYVPAITLPPVEAAIVQLKKALIHSISTEKRYLLNSLNEFRSKIFWSCGSLNTRKIEDGASLYARYKELIARVSLEVDSDWTDP